MAEYTSTTPLSQLGQGVLAGHVAAIAEFVRRRPAGEVEESIAHVEWLAREVSTARWRDPRMLTHKSEPFNEPLPHDPFWSAVTKAVSGHRDAAAELIESMPFEQYERAAFILSQLNQFFTARRSHG